MELISASEKWSLEWSLMPAKEERVATLELQPVDPI
jgi:hypothetical protein